MAIDYKHSAIILDKNKIIAGATNVPYKTVPDGSGIYGSAHAEVRAIRIALNALRGTRKTLKGLRIYVMRVNKHGLIKNSKPCKDCMSQIEKHGLKPSWSE